MKDEEQLSRECGDNMELEAVFKIKELTLTESEAKQIYDFLKRFFDKNSASISVGRNWSWGSTTNVPLTVDCEINEKT